MSALSKELRSFLTVSESVSIRAASDVLNISPAALSRQLHLLERSYGAALLVRRATGVTLTAEGELLRDEATRWMKADAMLLRRLRQNRSDTDLHVRIGLMESLVSTVLPSLSKRLEAEFGFVELDLVVGSTAELVARAEALEVDIIVAFNPPRLAKLIVVHSHDYHLGAVCAPQFPLAGDGPLRLAEALQHPLCLLSEALSQHSRLLAEILSERVNPRVQISSNSLNALLIHLKAGKGIGFLTWPDVCTDVDSGTLVFRPLENRRLMETLSVSVCRGNQLGKYTGEVVNHVTGILEELGY